MFLDVFVHFPMISWSGFSDCRLLWESSGQQYHGGTNFGRTSGAGITTSYDYDAPIDEYGLYLSTSSICYNKIAHAVMMKSVYHSKPSQIQLSRKIEQSIF